ncbi:MAG: YcaQ family DNA glycosylase [Anaerolineae bacterium]|nr:YcaQ family DNA glycosylase [Anaerolineae bacterium]
MMTQLPSSPLPLPVAQTLALHCQGLTPALESTPAPTPDVIYDVVHRLTCVQIDTLHVVQRSQYVTLWSRLGTYDPADFDRLIYDPVQRRLFEYWKHAASIIPLEDYRYRQHMMEGYKNGGGWWPDWAKEPENRDLIQAVHARIRDEGPLRTSDFKHDQEQGGSWWNWKPAKRALEHLYNGGDLMIGDRVHFQRVYDLRERVLPDWVDTSLPTLEDTHRHELDRAARALGIATTGQVADYLHARRGDMYPTLDAMLADGTLHEVQVTCATGAASGGADGEVRDFVVHRDTLPLLEQAADGAIQARRTTFLSPFDSLFWANDRDQQLWNYRKTLECYKPAPQREWGYFCLPILHREQLVGRFDPKMERKTGTLRLKALYLEPGTAPTDDLIAGTAAAMRDFMAFHNATDLVIEASDPAEYGQRLLAAL